MSLTWAQALAWRLRRQLLAPTGTGTVDDVVGRLGAVVAKDLGAAELAVRLRLQQSRAGDLAAALADGRVVKTYAFRGATHLMTPDQASVHLALRSASRMWELPSWQEYYGLAPEDWPALRDVVREALAGGPLTRTELADAVAATPAFAPLHASIARGNDTLLKPLAWQGVLCFGPDRGGRVTFASLEANPRWPGLPDLDDAGPRAVRTYLRSYGPATPERVHYWLGEGLGAGRRRVRDWLAGLDGVTTVDVGGESAAGLGEDLDDVHAAVPTDAVRLLPGHDQWVLGPGTADAHVVPPARRAAVTGGANLVLAGGVVSGTWTACGDEAAVDWFAEAGPAPTGLLDDQVARLGELLQRPLRATVRRA
ncbi:DNA glycosylase AlkZ-like family protein [Oceanitalea stevensii]|uniref:Winged helix DNA-binding domain-containing protein n=1 Tax=Oceanitalea stevensii TaxID=2763072 RepID=A0ABR8Z541_9MICO|nr:crosslink repair DNA glycosylase YcaQ family protein [Oceanitalea stevensii]MBD8063461.1 winged helix DNA-binding domain-containing protein [Oceanitalea stevensii]